MKTSKGRLAQAALAFAFLCQQFLGAFELFHHEAGSENRGVVISHACTDKCPPDHAGRQGDTHAFCPSCNHAFIRAPVAAVILPWLENISVIRHEAAPSIVGREFLLTVDSRAPPSQV